MKVQQELMRYASIQTTINIYGRAMTDSKRKGNSQVVGLILGISSRTGEGDLKRKLRPTVSSSQILPLGI
jgi:hypothetical protein